MKRFKEEMIFHLNSLKNIKGCFAEFGIFKGGTFLELLPIAKNQSKILHGFDSFRGMGVPSKFDKSPEGRTHYPKGKFNVFGTGSLISKLSEHNYKNNKDYFLWEGYIPKTFVLPPKDLIFSFCYIDVDHFEPTRDSLKWAYNKLSLNGIILCDDYFPTRTKGSASKAIKEFLEKNNDNIEIISRNKWLNTGFCGGQIAFKRKNNGKI